MKRLFTSIALASIIFSNINAEAISNKGFRADMSFLDFEELTSFFKPHHKQTVHIIRHADSPVKIVKAEVSDRGTVFFKGLSGAQNTYSVTVRNDSNRRILAYEVTWVLKHPFEDYVFHKIHSNSIDPVSIGETQTLKFRRSKHYRDDAYYYAEISKVEFDDDESIWEAPDLDDYNKVTRLDEVKQQIDEMPDDTGVIDAETLEMLKNKYQDSLKSDLDKLEEEGETGRVILQEITKEETTTTEEEIKTTTEESPVKTQEVTTTEETVESETIETKTIETPASSQEPILDPQKLMQAVDDLIKSKQDKNLILESDLVHPNSTEIKTETKTIEKVIEETSPVSESTVIDDKAIEETKSAVETMTVETVEEVKTKVENNIKTTTHIETEDSEEDDFDEDDEDFDEDDFDDFEDEEFEDDFDGFDEEDEADYDDF